MKRILLFSVTLIFGVFISRCGDNSRLKFDKIEHFTVIIDSLELKKEVYVVKHYSKSPSQFSNDVAVFLSNQPLNGFKARGFLFLKEHEKIELPLYEDSLDYRVKGTKLIDIYPPDVLGEGVKFLNDQNQIKQKFSLGMFFNPNK